MEEEVVEKTEMEKSIDKIEGNAEKPVVAPKIVEPRVFNETMSPEIGDLAGALALAQGAMSNGSKDKAGYGYSYLELSGVIDIARPALSKNGLSVVQSHELTRQGKTGSVVTHTTLMHSSGQWMKSSLELPIHIMKQLTMAQMIGVNCTYGRRYALQSLCMIASEDSDASGKE
ncbi:MAG: hypothetical protein DRG78_02805 [Epsilonproteobacteria bacterium]|nr:MAG: hypothetical protein DRG78_02805 [Campylobacterota bacterium]